jgi:hypothetical protein
MRKRPQLDATIRRSRAPLVQGCLESEACGLQLRKDQSKPLCHDGQEARVRDLLTGLQHDTPTAYLATITVIESLVRREVQQRYLDNVRSSHAQDNAS